MLLEVEEPDSREVWVDAIPISFTEPHIPHLRSAYTHQITQENILDLK